ncbi:MAG: hypothetical protein ACREMZ_01435 [Gemmatimonadales bacterium]
MSVAVRKDAVTGIEERLEHIATSRGLLYSWTARPPETSSCVLICSSVFGDFTANYHRERTVGRALAARGIGVVRFHYAGEGNSQGERCDMTFATLCDDAAAVAEHSRGLGFTRLAALGTRLGCLVAAASMPAAPLALWEPATDPLRFITEAQRAKRISQVAQEKHGNAGDWRQELANNGRLDLLGYDVYPPMIQSLAGVDLLNVIGSPRSVFVGRFRGIGAADPLTVALRQRGFPVETAVFGVSESWWFHNEFVSESGDLISATSDWLAAAIEEMA